MRTAARDAISDARNDVVVSAASIWEAAIKHAQGRLRVVPQELHTELDTVGFSRLSITAEHGVTAGGLPLHHKDPFDRMLVAQAQLEGLTLVTTDRKLAAYDVALLPA